MFKTLQTMAALASISAMTMGRDLTLEDSLFGDRQLKAVPTRTRDPFKPYFLKRID